MLQLGLPARDKDDKIVRRLVHEIHAAHKKRYRSALAHERVLMPIFQALEHRLVERRAALQGIPPQEVDMMEVSEAAKALLFPEPEAEAPMPMNATSGLEPQPRRV